MKSTNSNLFSTLVDYGESVSVSDLGTSGDVTIYFLLKKAADEMLLDTVYTLD